MGGLSPICAPGRQLNIVSKMVDVSVWETVIEGCGVRDLDPKIVNVT
jgi:hypothetical protein